MASSYQSINSDRIFVPIDILHSMFGLPSECTHKNVVRSCTLSFSCWIQGGRHAEGCGENKWLFSCCIAEDTNFNSPITFGSPVKPSFFDDDLQTRLNIMPSSIFKQNMLRRRMDSNGMV